MFLVSITFPGDGSHSEHLLVRRTQFSVGKEDLHNVIVDDMPAEAKLVVHKGLGRSFLVDRYGSNEESESFSFEKVGQVVIGELDLAFVSLDYDLVPSYEENIDTAGIRLMRRAVEELAPRFPAIKFEGAVSSVLSIHESVPLTIGRSRPSDIRLDVSEISGKHARLMVHNGKGSIEDLGSTNGTFLGSEQISGSRDFTESEVASFAGRVTARFALTERALNAKREEEVHVVKVQEVQDRFPALVSRSELVRPSRVVLKPGSPVTIGRDASHGMLVGAPHISREHCTLLLTPADGTVTVTDKSTNGTRYSEGLLTKGDQFLIPPERGTLFDLGAGVKIALCYSEEQEKELLDDLLAPGEEQIATGQVLSAPARRKKERPVQRFSKRDLMLFVGVVLIFVLLAIVFSVIRPILF